MASKKTGRRSTRARTDGAVQTTLLNALHQVWLAGLGAAARASRGAPKLFDELVAEGARFQTSKQALAEQTVRQLVGDARARLKDTLGDAQGRASDALENLEQIFQARVQRALTPLGIPSAEQLAALSKRVDVLNSHVDKLTRHTRSGARSNGRRRAPRAAAASAS